jgi:uncharacterized protein (DUF1330 family)
MTAYIIIHVDVTDMDQYREYTKLTPAVIEQYGGKFIVRNGNKVTLEGPEETRRLVVLEFPTMEQAQAFYYSPEYAEAKAVREGAATGQFVAVEGLE